MKEVKKIHANGKDILFIDYSFAKEKEMIELIMKAKKIIIDENRRQLLLSNFQNTYVTPSYLKVLRKEVKEILPLIDKNAIIGMNEPKKWILKGINSLFKTDFRSFDSEEEAIAFLTTDP